MFRVKYLAFSLFVCVVVRAADKKPTESASPESLLENAFQQGVILQDTNADGIADAVCGAVVVPDHSSAAENTAAANLAARIGYETTGLTLPMVSTAGAEAKHKCDATSANLWIGASAVPASAKDTVEKLAAAMEIGEGGVFAVDKGLVFLAADPVGLLAASNAYAARTPYQWSVPGEKLQAIAKTITEGLHEKKIEGTARLIGLTYKAGQAGIRRAILQLSAAGDLAAIRKALLPEEESALHISSVREVELLLPDGERISIQGSGGEPRAALPALSDPSGEEPRSLDLVDLYGIKGLLNGSPKKLVPASVAARFYVPSGSQGVAMANLAARIGLETTGIALPIAVPVDGVSPSEVHSSAVIAGTSQLFTHSASLLGAPGGTDLDKIVPGQFASGNENRVELPTLQAGEGELRVVEGAFQKKAALLVRGDERGSTAALNYAAAHLPYLWEPGKQYGSTAEVGDDVGQFFSLRSSTGQASIALYHLDQWLSELAPAGAEKKLASINAEVFVDEADPGLADFVRNQITNRIRADEVNVKVGSLHAGTKCCAADPNLHLVSNLAPFKQAEPTFAEDLTIPWEGKRLLEAVQKAAPGIKPGQAVSLEARVSEGPEERRKLSAQLLDEITKAGADPKRSHVVVLCAYKQGYSWLLDEITPELKNQHPAKLTVEFAKYGDHEAPSAIGSETRWIKELYPVDEKLAQELKIPLKNIQFARMATATGPTYRVHAYAADGHEILAHDFTVATAKRSYSFQFPHYEDVTVSTGWVHMEAEGKPVLDERVATDVEEFWDHYQSQTLPQIYKFVMSQNEGKPKTEYQPLFDTLRISVRMSEPDYATGVDQERISSLEALQEDTFFSTQNFFYMFGDLLSNGKMDYQGRVIPVVYPSRDGEDGQVRIEFYGKDAAQPRVRLTWRETENGEEHEKIRKFPMLALGKPKLVAARLSEGHDVQSLTWRVLVDSDRDQYRAWRKLVPAEQLEHTIMSAEQGISQLKWLEAMHSAGLYPDSLAYPHLSKLNFEFQLPMDVGAPEHTKPSVIGAEVAVPQPRSKRPQIADDQPKALDGQQHFVSWDEPIGTAETASIMSRLAQYPGVNVYWMGKSYLGENIWAADVMLPSPSELRSFAKETTLKTAIIYSGRQHANEVSSTSHILKLAEQLVTDPKSREALKKVNVVVHPITNPDGTNMSMELAKITPDNMLHPGYHGSLTADVDEGQWKDDPIYPESRTRRQLWEAWLPDAFLNPHGYASHEWVQPFSEYAGWVMTRISADDTRDWWIARGWFTSLDYLGDDEHPHSKQVTYALRDRIADNMAQTPGVLEMNARMNDRYERFGQRWDDRNFQQPIYKGVRIYMAVKGQTPDPKSPAFMMRFPDVTYDDGYTEAPDETAHGAWLHLVAAAGLAFDHAHLDYLAQAKYKIKRTQKEFFDGVDWKVDRERPVLPEQPDEKQASGNTALGK
ncbi:MAG: hypothetical protein JWO91_2265 [Acidobacteriaceae bacterium]|nr:hypothetical protein [Acidobacteriaceae bacterium]